jgi:protein phosphatase
MPGEPLLRVTIAGLTDPGRERDHNEDAIGWDAQAGLAVLADGMGGHNAGEVASEMAVGSIMKALAGRRPAGDEAGCPRALRTAVEQANGAIHAEAQHRSRCSGMGTTVAVACLESDIMTVAHVGDSRVYRLNSDGLRQLTSDHSVVQELVDSGFLSVEQARTSANRNVITRALGIGPTVEVAVNTFQASPGELFLLCSDGLSDLLGSDAIVELCGGTPPDLGAVAASLVDAANQAGGSDNISVILMRLEE